MHSGGQWLATHLPDDFGRAVAQYEVSLLAALPLAFIRALSALPSLFLFPGVLPCFNDRRSELTKSTKETEPAARDDLASRCLSHGRCWPTSAIPIHVLLAVCRSDKSWIVQIWNLSAVFSTPLGESGCPPFHSRPFAPRDGKPVVGKAL